MEFMLAENRDAEQVYVLVQETIGEVYPKYYLKEVVDMFCGFHSRNNILKDIEAGNTYILVENDGIEEWESYYKSLCFAPISEKRLWNLYYESAGRNDKREV